MSIEIKVFVFFELVVDVIVVIWYVSVGDKVSCD